MYYFALSLNVNFRFQTKVYDSCYNFMQKLIIFNDIAFVNVKENDLFLGYK